MESPWVAVVSGTNGHGGMVADPGEARRAFALFADPAAGCEVMTLRSGDMRTLPGADPDGLVRAAEELPAGMGVYLRVNPVPVGLSRAAQNADVVGRRWVYIDVDPVRAEGFKDDPATEEEKAGAQGVCEAVYAFLADAGWPAPVIVDSGNGFALFYRCDLPNDPIVRTVYQRLLKGLGDRFGGPTGVVDPSVHNANRLVKVPGTWARKGRESPGRPHRLCRLLVVPDVCDLVAFDLLSATAADVSPLPPVGVLPPPVPRMTDPAVVAGSWTTVATGDGVRERAYIRRAVEGEIAKVVLAQPGGRNAALNRAAYAIGGWVHTGEISRAEVEARLTEAARLCGLDRDVGCGPKGIRDTIKSGLDKGMAAPRTVPPPPLIVPPPTPPVPPPSAQEGVSPPAGDPPLTVNMAAVRPQVVEWLIPNRIPKRFLTVFAGRTAVGKSFVAHDLIARLTTGAEIPGAHGLCFDPGGALVIGEDSPEYVLAPRLIAAGADLTRVNAMTWEAMAKFHLGDTAMLERACAEVPGGVSLVMIDPPTNFLHNVSENRNDEVRQLIMHVVRWAFGKDLACVFVLHVNKAAKGVEALTRVLGSVAWTTTARVAHSFTVDPSDPDRCLWVPMKNNIGPLVKGLAYRITKDDPVLVDWLGEVDTTSDEAFNGEQKDRTESAIDWLLDRFREKLQWKSEELFAAAERDQISRNAVFAAKKTLNLPRAAKRTEESGETSWVWWVPPDWPPLKG